MPITDPAVQRLMGALTGIRAVTSRKMFGGVGIYCDGVFFAVIDDDRLYFKTDSVTDPEYDRYDAATWIIDGDPPSPMPYREVPAQVLSAQAELGAWIDSAVQVALRKKAKPGQKNRN